VFGPGLSIAHRGTIVVHSNSRVGSNCRLHVCVVVGTNGGSVKAPKIGNNVYIGPGAKLIGDIEIADGIAIGANAVVNQSFTEPNITIGGIPARRISSKGSYGHLIRATELTNTHSI
jgi:serine O-acetyltransferase